MGWKPTRYTSIPLSGALVWSAAAPAFSAVVLVLSASPGGLTGDETVLVQAVTASASAGARTLREKGRVQDKFIITFSRFEAADAATLEEHAGSVECRAGAVRPAL